MTAEKPAPRDAAQRPDPASPVAQFAARLRAVREGAGSPSFRHLARVTHYSTSTIADATAGRRLPTEQVVRAFVAACGQDPEAWVVLLQQAAALQARETASANRADADADPARRPGELGRKGSDKRGGRDRNRTGDGTGTGDAGAAASRVRRRIVPALVAVAALALGFGAGALTDHAMRTASAPQSKGSDTSAASAGAGAKTYTYPASDGADPIAAGCTGDAQLLDKVPVMHAGVQIGALELKYSPLCHAGWARVYLYPAGTGAFSGTLALVQVTAEDGTATMITARLDQSVPDYTDVVQPHGGCLSASAVVDADTTQAIPAKLSCDAPPAAPSTATLTVGSPTAS